MFSVDNFYDFFVSEYGHEKTNNFIMTFQPHGSKDLHNLEPFGISTDVNDFDLKYQTFNRIIMHDQEPLFLDYMDTYRKSLGTQKNLTIQNYNQKTLLEALEKKSNYELYDFMRIVMRQKPIICHSELNSDDIKTLNTQGFIDCYYWWHGMVARDWFRHWEHYQDLWPQNKSRTAQRFLLYSRAFDGTRSYRKEIVEHCKKHQNMVRYNWNGQKVDASYSAKIDISDSVAPIQIVTETLFNTGKIYLTEKVFKPMVMSQAFILFAPPGSLEYLKRYGFKTFDHCWDESYDQETDHNTRMSQLLNLIDQLASMPQDRFDQILEQAIPVIEYNRKRFFSTAFQDDLILEMRTNINQALLKQN